MIVDDLKKSILQICFNGELSSTLENDTDVHKSLEKIRVQKNELVKKYNVRNEPDYKAISENEKLFTIPNTWTWLRIGQLGVFKKGPFGSALTKGMFVKKSNDSIKVYEQKNAIQKDENIGEYYITRDYFESKMKGFEVKTGDIIVSCAGTIGETFVIPENHEIGIINQALMKMTMVEELNVSYFLLYFDFILKKMSNSLSSGSAIKNIPPFEIFKQLVIPLPPIEEQQRIVDKIKVLFAKLDEIKPIEEELNLIRNNFPNDMKKSLLNFAMNGKLVSSKNKEKWNLSLDNNFYTQLWKVTIWDKKFKDVEKSHQIKTIKYKYLLADEMKKLNKNSGNVYLLSTGNYEGWTNEETAGTYLSEGEIIAIPWGGSPNVKYYKGKFVTTDNRIATSIDKNILDNKYLYYFMMSKLSYLDTIYRGTSLRHPNMKSVLDMLIPLPPIEEQQRIVEKIEQLLPLCNDIENLISE